MMKTKKNIFLSILLIAIISLSSLVLFACGDKGSSEKSYNLFQETITTFKTDDMFYNSTLNNISSKYFLNDFYYKNSSGEKIYEQNNYLILGGYGLNFIEKYYENLNGLELNVDYTGLDSSVQKMTNDYKTLKIEYSRLKKTETSLNYEIYNGYFARYRLNSITFINSVYDCALSLSNFLTNNVKLDQSVGDEEMTTTAYQFYIDKNYLNIFSDFKEFFLNNCRGMNIDNTEFQKTMEIFNQFSSNIVSKDYKLLQDEDLKNLTNILSMATTDRKNAWTALNKFSLYEYVTTYGSSIEACCKSDINAEIYYNRLNNYFWNSESTLNNLYTFLTNNLVANQ